MDLMLEQFDRDEFDCADRREDQPFATPMADQEPDTDEAANIAAMAFEQSFNDDVDSLFDAELIIDDELGGRKYDDDEVAAADNVILSVTNITPYAHDDDHGTGREAVTSDEIDAATHQREISLEQHFGDDDTDKLIACLSVCETDDGDDMHAVCDDRQAAETHAPEAAEPSDLDAILVAGACDAAMHDDDDTDIMASSMHQPVMAFEDAPSPWTVAPEATAIFQISEDKGDAGALTRDVETNTVRMAAVDDVDGEDAGPAIEAATLMPQDAAGSAEDTGDDQTVLNTKSDACEDDVLESVLDAELPEAKPAEADAPEAASDKMVNGSGLKFSQSWMQIRVSGK